MDTPFPLSTDLPQEAPTRALVAALRSGVCYPHPVADIEVHETHISYVILAGPYAYKIKKPVTLAFLDFATLEARRFYCHEELRLNRRTAPDLYLDVVPITGSVAAPVVDGPGPAIEYAVRMIRFDPAAGFDRLARAGVRAGEHLDALAKVVARFHRDAARAPLDSDCGSPRRVLAQALDNFREIEALEAPAEASAALARLRDWTLAEHQRLEALLAARLRDGFVRECHGDLHLGNVVLLKDVPVLYDCLEFDTRLRTIDVVSEVAFTAMDLEHHGLGHLAARFLGAYLEQTGDYAGLAALRFYGVYRAMVRAKIACIRAREVGIDAARRAAALGSVREYVALAARLASERRAALVLMHGLSGSGKTTVSSRLVEALQAVRIRSDIERKRLHRIGALEPSDSAPGGGIYTPADSIDTYAHLEALACGILAAGYPAIVDATFLKRSQRDGFRALATAMDVPFAVAACESPEAALRERLDLRSKRLGDASEADAQVLALQIAACEPPGESEHALIIETTRMGAVEAAVAALACRVREAKRA